MPYTLIIKTGHILESMLYSVEETDYPHGDHPALRRLKSSLREVVEAIHDLEPLQAEVTQQRQGPQLASRTSPK